MEITVSPEPLSAPDSRRLVAALDEYLSEMYALDSHHLDLNEDEVAPGSGIFLVARADGIAVGCGALRRISSETAELRRMFVAESNRGRGVGGRLLDALEEFASRAGYRRLRLETGIHQPVAIAFYTTAGFTQVPRWATYEGADQSVCFEKSLQPSTDPPVPPSGASAR